MKNPEKPTHALISAWFRMGKTGLPQMQAKDDRGARPERSRVNVIEQS